MINELLDQIEAKDGIKNAARTQKRSIQTFCQAKNATPASFHIIGHSLGSHVAGNAGKFLGKGVLGRITGLDPAGPFFEGLQPEARLWHTDAQYVDSIHTDARPLLEVGFGMYETCSHVDIYPNGGKVQPGCDRSCFVSKVTNLSLPVSALNSASCEMMRSSRRDMPSKKLKLRCLRMDRRLMASTRRSNSLDQMPDSLRVTNW
ncbi:MAG: hypothetical protein ACQPRI_06405 [Solitalea-like symbiont of Tyrophagus putrescentiae]